MLSPGTAPVPQTRPFLAATAQFASGDDTPRAYLERCLEALATWEPKIGAFVQIRIDDARAAADTSTARWEDGRPLSANMAARLPRGRPRLDWRSRVCRAVLVARGAGDFATIAA